ncbi:MAG TPA: hypothetical protein VHB47_02280 [Thermoanaerobaculia bacterium]|nr:hypothetical protein [Thermoanaerobaculia bacterium]
MDQIIQGLLQARAAGGRRSTVLQPLLWVLAVLLAAIVAMARSHVPDWIVGGTFFCAVGTLALIAFAYIHLLFKDYGALRSERFNLAKMSIEKGVMGDDLRGLLGEFESRKGPLKRLGSAGSS